MNDIEISKFLSLILRHKPKTIGLILDDNGWADVGELIEKSKDHNVKFDFERLKILVEKSDKKRFSFNTDYSKIRANQGHSLSVDLSLKESQPPDILYHGTAEKNIESINKNGILRKERHHVHLSKDKTTGKNVAIRYGKPIILAIDAKQMNEDGIKFYLSENGVWLTEKVDSKYINITMINKGRPEVIEISLKKDYQFMYKNFIISAQQDLYLLLEEGNGIIDALKFNFLIYKYGYPNDEALGAHAMYKYGLGFYGLYEVVNSPWIIEIRDSNRIHPSHNDNMYSNYKHYIVRFKDVTLDVICTKMEELQLTKEQLIEIVNKEIEFIKE